MGLPWSPPPSKAGRMLMIGHVLPFFPEYRFAYDAITGGKYGRIQGGHFKRIISDPLWMPRFYDPAVIGGPMLDLHVHDAHFIRTVCGMPRSVQCAGSMRGEVVERFHAQFRFDDPQLIVTAASGVIAQQGRPFTHGFEIYLEKATLLYDFAVLGGEPVLATPLTVLTPTAARASRTARRRRHHALRERIGQGVRAVQSASPRRCWPGSWPATRWSFARKRPRPSPAGRRWRSDLSSINGTGTGVAPPHCGKRAGGRSGGSGPAAFAASAAGDSCNACSIEHSPRRCRRRGFRLILL